MRRVDGTAVTSSDESGKDNVGRCPAQITLDETLFSLEKAFRSSTVESENNPFLEESSDIDTQDGGEESAVGTGVDMEHVVFPSFGQKSENSLDTFCRRALGTQDIAGMPFTT